MTMQMNQFNLTPLKGRTALVPNQPTIPVMIDTGSVNTLVPGDHVVLTTTAGPTIYVDKATAAQVTFGVVAYTPKKSTFTAKDAVEIVLTGSIMWGQAHNSVTRGDQLEFYPTGSKLMTNAGNPVCGIALDSATDGNLFRYIVLTPETVPAAITSGSINNAAIGGSTPAAGKFTTLEATGQVTHDGLAVGPGGGGVVYSLRTRVTLADTNTGKTLLAAVTGRKYRLVSSKIIAYGANAAATANATGVAIKGTQTTGVNLVSTVLAGLTRSAVNTPTTTNTTVLADGASFIACDVTTAITFGAVGGTDLITATGFDVEVQYAIE